MRSRWHDVMRRQARHGFYLRGGDRRESAWPVIIQVARVRAIAQLDLELCGEDDLVL